MKFFVTVDADILMTKSNIDKKYYGPVTVELNSLDEINAFSNELRNEFGQEILFDFNSKYIWVGKQIWASQILT